MIIKTLKTAVHKSVKLDYENGISCIVNIVDEKVVTYTFYSDAIINKRLDYIEDKDLLLNTHWSNHYELVGNCKDFSIDDLITFSEFDNLFYIGGSNDGMTANRDGKFLSTPIIIDNIFSQIYLKIEKKKKKCQDILNSLNQDYIIKSSVEEIPYYNQNDKKKHHYTITLTMKLPDDVYTDILGEKNYFDDSCKLASFNFLRNKL